MPRVADAETFVGLQKAVEEVTLDPSLVDYIVELVRRTRQDTRSEVGASPRGSLALQKLSRARALLDGRDFVLPDDIKAFALPALSHRIIVKPEPWIRGVRGTDIVRAALDVTTVPKLG